MVSCEDTNEVTRKMWVWFIWSKQLGRMGHNMLKWLVIELASCLYKSELCFKVIERKYNNAANENFDIDLIVTNKKIMQKYRKLSPDSDDTLHSELGKTEWSYDTFFILTNYHSFSAYL